MKHKNHIDGIYRIAGYGIVHSVIKQSLKSKKDGLVFYTKCGNILYENPRMYACYGTRYCKTELPVNCKNCLRLQATEKLEKATSNPSCYIAILRPDTVFEGECMNDILENLKEEGNSDKGIIKMIESKEIAFFKAHEIEVEMETESVVKLLNLFEQE